MGYFHIPVAFPFPVAPLVPHHLRRERRPLPDMPFFSTICSRKEALLRANAYLKSRRADALFATTVPDSVLTSWPEASAPVEFHPEQASALLAIRSSTAWR